MASHNPASTRDPKIDFWWMMMCIVLAFLVLLASAPTFILGFFAERYTSKYRWSFALWFLLLFPSAGAFYYVYQHGLSSMITRELVDYIQTFKHYQTDFARWNVPRLWSETWTVWLWCLLATPWVGFWQEVSLHARGGQTVRQQQEQERSRQHRIQRAQERAQKRTQRPERLPDAVRGLMVIGVPIDDEEQE